MSDHIAVPLTVKDLTYRYRQREAPALQNVSFTAQAGEIILVAGASGSGKTTLMRCLNGLIPHSYKGGDLSGLVRVLGTDPALQSLAQTSQLVGTVLQNPEKQIVASYVSNEVAFGLENLGVPRDEMKDRIIEVLRDLKIAHLHDRESFHLSGGEKQKVAIAGVLVMKPSILLLDEPLANLDPFSLRETLQLIRELADSGITVLIIEHRVEDVLQIKPDKVLFLVDGLQKYFGDVNGFELVVDPREVKLPATMAIRRLREMGYASEPPTTSANGHEPDGPPLVSFADVDYWYEKDQPVLQSVSFDIRRGDVIAILGPNGAGKTTLVKQAIGLLKPRDGAVTIGGVNSRSQSVAQTARTVGFVFQSPSHMLFAPTVGDELAFGPRNMGMHDDVIRQNVSAALRTVDLVAHEEDAPLSLSFGQQKRVTIAAVIAMSSRVLIMDEPTAGQDYRHYSEFMDAILHPPSDGPWQDVFDSILFITHDLDLAVSYANRVLLVSEGRIVADGPPQEVLQDMDLLERCRLTPTSLLTLNIRMFSKTGRFLRPEHLAGHMATE